MYRIEKNLKTLYSKVLTMAMCSDDLLRRAVTAIGHSEYLIALTGAGISKESNVPTFRGSDGLWKQYDAMQLANPSAFRTNPRLVWEWYSWRQSLIAGCSPNAAHEVLAVWEQKGLLKSLITQNVDGLHQRAGSISIHEVHGNIWSLRCTSCGYRGQLDRPAIGIPACPSCNSNLRPDVIWFGEILNQETMSEVYSELKMADVCIVIGTSALVQPAATFPLIVKEYGGIIIEVNPDDTPLTSAASMQLKGSAGHLLPKMNSLLR